MPPLFLDLIAPPDFRAVGEEGCFVYCYLRSKSSELAGKPYYIGVASRYDRPLARHSCSIPKDRSRIRILRSGLTVEEAESWEIFYIQKFGRKDKSQKGILRNLTDGGEGVRGYVFTAEHRKRMSEARKGTKRSKAAREKSRAAMIGRKQSAAHTDAFRNAAAKRAAEQLGVEADWYKALPKGKKDLVRDRWAKGLRGEDLVGELFDQAAGRRKAGVAQKRGAAGRYGIDESVYLNLTDAERARVIDRWHSGSRGEDLTKNLGRSRADLFSSRTETAAKRFDVPLDFFEGLTRREKTLLRTRFNQGHRGVALIRGLGSTVEV